MTLLELVERVERALDEAGVSFGQGTLSAFDEAAWLVLWALGLPLNTPLNDATRPSPSLSAQQLNTVEALLKQRIESRKPLAYLTQEAWLQGVSFYIDERAIVPRSLIAERLVDGSLDLFFNGPAHRILDLCTGNGSLAILAAMTYPSSSVTGADLSEEALEVARINLVRHGLENRIDLFLGDGLLAPGLPDRGPFDLVLCNPPYVCASSMASLPPEFLAEPGLALDGNQSGGSDGMDFVRRLLRELPKHLSAGGVLVLEIGNERAHFEAAFPALSPLWLETSAGADQVLVLNRADLEAMTPLAATSAFNRA